MKNIRGLILKYKIQIAVTTPILFVLMILEFLALRGDINLPETINLFVLNIHIYSITMLLGVLVIVFGSDFLKKYDKDLKKVVVDEVVIYAVIPAIIGARLWHVVTDWSLYDEDPIEAIYIWNGGIGIYGAVLGVILGVWFYTKVKKKNLLKILNVAAFFLPLAQVIGRYGNFFNQELYGPQTDLPWGMFIRPENRLPGLELYEYFHPAFLYEQIGNMLLMCINLFIFKKFGLRGNFFLGTWLVGYGLVRFVVEFFRLSDKDIVGLSVNQVVSMVVILSGIIYLFIQFKNLQHEKEI